MKETLKVFLVNVGPDRQASLGRRVAGQRGKPLGSASCAKKNARSNDENQHLLR